MDYKNTDGFEAENIDRWIQDAMKNELPTGLTTFTDAAMGYDV